MAIKFAIENENGQWWTGECWGVKEARIEFYDRDDLPLFIGEDKDEMTLLDDREHYGFCWEYDSPIDCPRTMASVREVR